MSLINEIYINLHFYSNNNLITYKGILFLFIFIENK